MKTKNRISLPPEKEVEVKLECVRIAATILPKGSDVSDVRKSASQLLEYLIESAHE